MKVKRFARVMALSLSLALAVPSVVPGAALTAEAATKEVAVLKGKTKTLKVSAKNVTWKSSNKSVATVKKGKVTAKKVGKATITAVYGSKKKAWDVSVVALNKKSLKLNGMDATTAQSGKGSLRVLGLSEDQQQEVYWDTSDVKVATVTEKEYNPSRAEVTPRHAGTATITATYRGIKMTCEVNVSMTGNQQKPVAYPSQARAYNTEDNTENVLEPTHNGKWNDVTLEALDMEFVAASDTTHDVVNPYPGRKSYTYRLKISGTALGEVKNGLYPVKGPEYYWNGVESVDVFFTMVTADGNDKNATFTLAQVNDSNERTATCDGTAGKSLKGVKLPFQSAIQLNCDKKTGSFTFYRDIVADHPIKEVYVNYIGVTKPYGSKAMNPAFPGKATTGNDWVKWPALTTATYQWNQMTINSWNATKPDVQ